MIDRSCGNGRTAGKIWFNSLIATVNRTKQADAECHEDPTGTTRGEQGQRDSLGWSESCYDGKVDQGLDRNGDENPEGQQSFKGVGGVVQNLQTNQHQGHVQRHHEEAAHDSKFLTDDGEEEIGRIFRQITEFLNTVAESTSNKSTTGDRRHGLQDVISSPLRIRIRIEKGPDSINAVRAADQGDRDS